jgi:hypothetical protein
MEVNDIENALAYCGPVLITAVGCFMVLCGKVVKYLLNGTGDFEQLKLEPIEGTSERVKKNIFYDKNEGNSNHIFLYLILNYQIHYFIVKFGELYVFVSDLKEYN